jgi:hypothetical protein
MLRYYIPDESLDKTISLSNVTNFAIEEDVQQLFEKPGYHPEMILMVFKGTTGNNLGITFVVLPDAQQARSTMQESTM